MTTAKQARQRGKLIADARKKKGLSQEQLAGFCDVTRAAVSEWESGKVRELKPEKAFILSAYLGIPREKLVSEFVLQQIGGGIESPGDLVTPIRGLVSSEAERIAIVWDRLDSTDPLKKLIAEVLDRVAAS